MKPQKPPLPVGNLQLRPQLCGRHVVNVQNEKSRRENDLLIINIIIYLQIVVRSLFICTTEQIRYYTR